MAVVKIPQEYGVFVLVLNILIPGLGSVFAGFIAEGNPAFNNVIVGLL